MFEDTRTRQSVFRSDSSLNPDTGTGEVVGRETEIQRIADAVRPLAKNSTPENLLVYGPPGVGKTTCVNHVLEQLEDQTNAKTVYINC
jgi:cell division control protein 6